MKTFLLALLLCCIVSALSDQKLEQAKDLLKARKLTEAKTLIDEVLKDAAAQRQGEAWYIKSKIYTALADDQALSSRYPGIRMEAFNALKKYTEIDDKMLISLQIDGYAPINQIYTGFYQEAAGSFNKQGYAAALENFKNAILVSSFMNEKKWITMTLDTNSVLYAGVSAEKLNRFDDAAFYYGMLAEAKAQGQGFVEIYKWVANYHYEKKDVTKAMRFLGTGRQVYPNDPFWNSLELDITREKGNKDELFALYEKTIAAEPANHLYRYNYAVELYQHAYNVDATRRVPNSAAYIRKAEEQVTAATKLKPDYARAHLFAGQIRYNGGVDLLNEQKAIRETGAEADQRKADLKVKIMRHWDEAIPFFQAVEKLLSPMAKLSASDKADLKEAYDLMITIYDQKGQKDKVKEYEVKFGEVDKKQ